MHNNANPSKGLGSISYSAGQSMKTELMFIEDRVEKVIRVYGHKIQVTRDYQEPDNISNKLHGKL